MSTCSDPSRRLVFVSLEPWDDIWRRNQFVCRELAGRGWEILFVEPAADWSAGLRRRDWSQFHRRPVWSPEGLPGIKVVRPIKFLPKSLKCSVSINQGMVESCVARHITPETSKDTVLWINNQEIWPLADRYEWKRVIYDITDDWTRGFAPGRTRDRIIVDDRELCARADQVIVCSQRLYDLKRCDCRHVSLISNGVDFESYSDLTHAVQPEATKHWCQPVLGYTGTLHGARMDLELLHKVASDWQGTVALVGPDHLGKAGGLLDGLKNVVRTGPVPHTELPGWMSAMDVMIVPHRVTDFTESLNPLKLWEYLAAGLPIVSTPVAGFRDFPEHVYLAQGADCFSDACRNALSEGSGNAQSRRDIARDHSWSNRVQAIERVLTGQARLEAVATNV